ncbi:TPA: cobaltochelatase CobT-related protein, partial [Photobacterium damselae]
QQNGDESKDDNSQSNGNQKNGDESKDDNSQSNGNQQNGDESKANKQSNVNSNQHQQISDATKEILDGDAKNPMETDVGKVLAEKLSNQSKEDVKEGKVDSTDLRDSNQLNSTNIIEEEMKEDLRYVKMLSECAEKQTVFVRNRIRNLIASKMLVKTSRKMTGRRLISTACSKLAVGDSRVFQKKQQQKMENTAITILLDDSGSMDGESGQVAAIATQAIIQAISPINFVSTSVLAFGSHSCTNKIYRIKTFDESPYRCIKRLSSHLSKEGCATPLLTGLWSGLKELSERQESRKVMLVITDGAPDSKAACSQLITRIRQSSDVEVFGIGITKAKHLVGALFGEKYAVSVDDINQLADEIFKLSEQILIK